MPNFLDEIIDQCANTFDKLKNQVLQKKDQVNEVISKSPGFTPRVDVFELKEINQFKVIVELPGINKKDIKLQIAGDALYIYGEKLCPHLDHTHNYSKECTFGPFNRKVQIPNGVDLNNVNAEIKDGILEITMPYLIKKPQVEQENTNIEIPIK